MKVTKWLFVILLFLPFIGSSSHLMCTPQAKTTLKTSTTKLPKPDLIVEKIKLDRSCRIVFTLKNVGKGAISAPLHRLGKVTLWIGRVRYNFSFVARSFVNSVDAKGLLRKPGGRATFNTRKVVKKPTTAVVVVDSTKKITESNEFNNRRSQPLKPKCLTVLKPSKTTIQGTTPQTGAAKPPATSQVRYPSPTATINAFYMRRGSTSTTTTMMSMGGTPAFRSSYTVDYQDEIHFRYRATGCNVADVTTKLEVFRPGESSPFNYWNTDDDTRIENRCFSTVGKAGSRQVQRTMDYKLTVTAKGTNPMLRKSVSKTIRVNVRRPELVLERPVVIDSGGVFKVELWVKNRGRIDYPGSGARIYGRFWVLNHHNPSHEYFDSRFEETGVVLNAGDRKKVATFTVEPRNHLTAARKIILKAEANDGRDMFAEGGKTTEIVHTFREQTLEMDTDILFSLLAGMMSGNIRLNNYRPHSGNTTTSRPGVSNDCRIHLGSEDTRFTIPFWSIKVKGKVTGHVYIDYRPFFNDINATVGDARDFSVPRRNSVKLVITFETAGTEIKGYDYDDGVYNDDKMPDINLQKLKLEISFYLNVVHGQLRITNISLSPTIEMNAEGRYANLLNMFKSKLNEYVNGNLSNMIKNMLGLESFVTRLNSEIKSALGLMGIHTIDSVELTASKLRLTYR